MNTKDLLKKITEAVGEELSAEDLFGYLKEEIPEGLITTDDNTILLRIEDEKIKGFRERLWDGTKDVLIFLTPEDCKDKNTLLNKLKELKVFHPQTEAIKRNSIDEQRNFVLLYGLVNPENPKINIVRSSGGRGTTMTLIKNVGEDAIRNAINKKGINVKDYEVIKETPNGTLIGATIRPYGTKKAFLFKDGEVKSVSIAKLLQIIKEL